MLNDWKKAITNGWTFIRFVRLGIAISILNEAWKSSSVFFAMFGMFFLVQALLNLGCFGSNGCEVDRTSKSSSSKLQDISFKEIK